MISIISYEKIRNLKGYKTKTCQDIEIFCINKIEIIKQKCFKNTIHLVFVFFTDQKYNLFLINSVIAII